MDVNDLRIAVTLLSFVIFIGIVVWAWSRKNAARFDEAAQLPFMDSDDADRSSRAERRAAPKPARTPAGGRPMCTSDGRSQ
ncbi:MAG: CcoQ/FixQ family Cbb3-type cytochrome c oxidase assembly chaperone [Burkholderiales bacterium]|nr:CcoQ/FixQ family Cbb3-type cytochrome c oxidase assembly chaperone [Burkholderiales bacterium]